MSLLPSGTVTFVFTDIEGSTKLAQQYPDQWESLRARHHAILQSALDAHNGFVFQIIGDAFCVAFHTAKDGINAAIEAQQKLQSEDWGKSPIRVRMGLHTGSAEYNGSDYRGYLTMAKVQRIMSVAYGGQVLISSATAELLHHELPSGITFRDMKEQHLKGLSDRERLWQIVAPGIEQDFPPIQSAGEILNNLPTQLTSFVGRRKELEDVKTLLQNTPMLTLIGPGGTGKTRLSIQAASELLDHYADGIWLVELAPIFDPLLVPRTTAMAIGLRDEPQRPVADMLCDYLHNKKMLIVLDNCEHLVDACAHMAERILRVAQNVHILASSREALGIAGEVTYRVPSLGLPDVEHLPSIESLSQYEAVKLFIERAMSAIQTFRVTNDNAPALAQICYRLDGIPLAIELAAAKIRVLSVEQIAERLDDRFKLLTGGSRTAVERHQTLRATIDWSYNLLPPEEQILFRRVAIFVNGWSLEAVESVCADDSVKSDAVLDLLEHLINKSMVLAEESQHATRYRILETIRQYANEKLVESGESDRLRDKHLDYFLSFTEQAAPHLIRAEQLDWLAHLDADHENIRIALEWALSQESAEHSLRLCAALGKFWQIRCYWLEGSNWLQEALTKATPIPSKPEQRVRVRALYWDVFLADELDDFDKMKLSGERCYGLAQEVSDRLEIAIARIGVGRYLYRREDYEGAFSMLEKSYADLQELKSFYWAALSYKWLRNILDIKGNCDRTEISMCSVELARRAGERKLLADTLLDLSYWHFRNSQLDEAAKCSHEADLLLKEVGSNPNRAASAYADLAWAAGNYQEAGKIFMDIQERLGMLGEKNMRSADLSRLGLVTIEQGNIDQAQIYLEQALATARELGNKRHLAFRLAELSIVYHLKGSIGKYKQVFMECIRLTKGLYKIHKVHPLLMLLQTIYPRQLQISIMALGVIDAVQKKDEHPVDPITKLYWNRIEICGREALGDVGFETATKEGQKFSIDEMLDLVMKTLDGL